MTCPYLLGDLPICYKTTEITFTEIQLFPNATRAKQAKLRSLKCMGNTSGIWYRWVERGKARTEWWNIVTQFPPLFCVLMKCHCIRQWCQVKGLRVIRHWGTFKDKSSQRNQNGTRLLVFDIRQVLELLSNWFLKESKQMINCRYFIKYNKR